jgi:hypothetical protein
MLFTIFAIPMELLCTLFSVFSRFPFVGKLPAAIGTLIYIFAFLMVFFLIKKWAIIYPNKFPWFISGPYMFFQDPIGTIKNKLNPFKKKDGFISHPLKYKKQLNNDGGIGWVPYYGKPGRSCEEDKDCPTFQKCDGDKCVIPPRVR